MSAAAHRLSGLARQPVPHSPLLTPATCEAYEDDAGRSKQANENPIEQLRQHSRSEDCAGRKRIGVRVIEREPLKESGEQKTPASEPEANSGDSLHSLEERLAAARFAGRAAGFRPSPLALAISDRAAA